jgi:hypothetical protein
MPFRPLVLMSCLLGTAVAQADTTATTEDGRKVVLRDNGTWSLASDVDDDRKAAALLTLEKRFDLARGCRLGLRLQNDLPAQVRTLVIRFTAYKGPEIPFETVSRGYSYLKPTTSQYQEIDFRGISCDEISSVEVSAARNCHVGELTKYSATAEDCLKLFDVADSDIMPIAKRSSLD